MSLNERDVLSQTRNRAIALGRIRSSRAAESMFSSPPERVQEYT